MPDGTETGLTLDVLPVRLRRLREQRNISQRALSELSGLSIQYISALECGKKKPGIAALLRYVYGLGYRLKDLEDDIPLDAQWRQVLELIHELPVAQQEVIQRELLPTIVQLLRKDAPHYATSRALVASRS